MKGAEVQRLSPLLALLLLAALAACEDPPSISDAMTLSAGAIVVGLDGVSVAAPVGSLDAPVELSIESAVMPAASLPTAYTTIGGVYRIVGKSVTRSIAGTGFIVGLPIPPGADPDRLRIAVLATPELSSDSGGEDRWVILRSVHHAPTGLIAAFLAMVVPEGMIFVMVEAPAAPAGAMAASAATTPVLPPDPLVTAFCSDEYRVEDPAICGAAEIQAAVTAFEKFHAELNLMGFREPLVVRGFELPDIGLAEAQLGSYVLELRPCAIMMADAGISAAGFYNGGTLPIEVCVPDDGWNAGIDSTVRHELFHATQAAYGPFEVPAGESSAWSSESQAAAAEFSTAIEMRRSPSWGFRPIFFLELTREDLVREYETQDFWVRLGGRWNLGLGMLIPFLERGPGVSQVDQAIKLDIGPKLGVMDPEIGDLGSAYWEWVKGTFFTPGLPTGNPDDITELHSACEGSFSGFLEFDPQADGQHVILPVTGISPLASKLFEVQLAAPESYPAVASISSTDDDIEYAWYVVDEGGFCNLAKENASLFIDMQMGSPFKALLLVSNTALKEVSLPFNVNVDVPSISLVPESAFFSIDEGDAVPASFEIHNHGDDVSYLAEPAPGSDWLTITNNAEGVVFAGDAREVEYEVSCPSGGRTDVGEIELEFRTAGGDLVEGNGVPESVLVEVECDSPPTCIDANDVKTWTGGITMQWSDSGSGSNPTRSISLSHSASISYEFGSGTSILSGTAGINDSFTVTFVSTGLTQVTTWDAAGPVEEFPASGGSSFVAVFIDSKNSTYTVQARALVSGDKLITGGDADPVATEETMLPGQLAVSDRSFGLDLNLSGGAGLPACGSTAGTADNCFTASGTKMSTLAILKGGLDNVNEAIVNWGFKPKECYSTGSLP